MLNRLFLKSYVFRGVSFYGSLLFRFAYFKSLREKAYHRVRFSCRQETLNAVMRKKGVEMDNSWYQQWFNQDYLKLYKDRNRQEAEQQIDFLIQVLELSGQERILDLSCGTGRHSFTLAHRGFTVVGVDLSPIVIEEAKKELKGFPSLPLTFVIGDMRELKGLGIFDVVVSLFTSFGYFSSDRENAAVFGSVRMHLKKGGQFFLDYLHPEQVKGNLVPYEKRLVEGEEVEIYRKIEGDTVIKNIEFPGRKYQERVKLYSRDQVEQMLKEHSFEIVATWDDYQGNPWNANGNRQIFRCCAQGV